jgi:hypothetical protein
MNTELCTIQYEYKENQLYIKSNDRPFCLVKDYVRAIWNVMMNHSKNNDDCAIEFTKFITCLKKAAMIYEGILVIRIIQDITNISVQFLEFIIKMSDKEEKTRDKREGVVKSGVYEVRRDTDTGKILCLSCASPPAPEKKLLKCGKCYLAHYCGATCQKDHWKEHKKNCCK